MKPNKKLLRFLQQFFIQKPELHHPDDGHLLPTQEFYQLLDKERFRADRLNNPFSLVIIPLPEHLQAPEQLRQITSQIHSQTRLIDELGWFAPGTLGLYLFNTPEAGARRVLQRIRSNLDVPEILEDVQVMVYPDTEQRVEQRTAPEDIVPPPALSADDNRRQQERVNLSLVATIQPIQDGLPADTVTQTTTRDISATGAYLLTPMALPPDTQLELEVLLPFDELAPLAAKGEQVALKAVGHVVRAEQEGLAVQFDNPHGLKALAQVAQQNLAQKS